MYEIIFLRNSKVLDSNLVTLTNMTSLQTFYGHILFISEHSEEAFSLESDFVEVENSGLQACNVSQKGPVLQCFFGIFEISEHFFLSNYFQKSICSAIFSPIIGSRL